LLALANQTAQSNAEFQSYSNTASRAIGDLYVAYPLIIGGAILAFVLSLVYMKLVQCAAGLLVYTALALVLAGGAFICTCLRVGEVGG
jgi:hypothetical protein